MMNNVDAAEKIKKLLKLSRSSNPNEAAVAAVRAAELMEKYNIEEATIRLDDDGKKAEPIAEEVMEKSKKRVAWKGAIAGGLAHAFGAKMFWIGGDIHLFGRKTAMQAINYMFQYLVREVERLADEGYAYHKAEHLFPGNGPGSSPRSWKNGFRLGAAATIANRLYAQRAAEVTKRKEERAAAQSAAKAEAPVINPDGASVEPSRALAVINVVEKDEEEVAEAYTKRSKGFRTVRNGSTRAVSAYGAGQRAGRDVNLNGGRGLGAPSPKLRS